MRGMKKRNPEFFNPRKYSLYGVRHYNKGYAPGAFGQSAGQKALNKSRA